MEVALTRKKSMDAFNIDEEVSILILMEVALTQILQEIDEMMQEEVFQSLF